MQTSSPSKDKLEIKHTTLDDEDEPREWHGHEKVMMTNLDGKPEVDDGEYKPDYDSMMTPQEMIEA